MEKALNPSQPRQLFDNNALFDAEGHLTDGGLQALQDGRLDELGSLEAAEHLTFCDLCLARYTELVEAVSAQIMTPMRDLIPEVQALMWLRRFRIMTNRYVSVAAAVILAFSLWRFGFFGQTPGMVPKEIPGNDRPSLSQMVSGVFDAASEGITGLLDSVQATAQSGIDQLANPNLLNNGGHGAADGE